MGLVDLTRFERVTSTFAKSRSYSAELQVQGIFDFRFLSFDFQRHATTHVKRPIKNQKSQIKNVLAEGTGLEPASDGRGSFQDYCLTS